MTKECFLEDIHTIKLKNLIIVVFDFKLTKEEDLFSKKRMKFVACLTCKKNFMVVKKCN